MYKRQPPAHRAAATARERSSIISGSGVGARPRDASRGAPGHVNRERAAEDARLVVGTATGEDRLLNGEEGPSDAEESAFAFASASTSAPAFGSAMAGPPASGFFGVPTSSWSRARGGAAPSRASRDSSPPDSPPFAFAALARQVDAASDGLVAGPAVHACLLYTSPSPRD